ncbi:MAG: hypothetical protein ACE5DO_14445, partial [Desulfobacterales bacterium]
SNISLNSLKREMTVPLSQYADMVPMFQEEEGSREPFRIFYTRMGIYKVNPYDPSFPAGHVLKIGGTGFGKTFDTLGEIVNEHLHGTNIIYVSCKGEAERLTNVLGGIHDDLSVDGSTKLLPFTIPESVRKDRNNFVSAISQMVDFLQFMTGNKEKEVEFTYQEILKTLFTRKEYVSVTRIADILTERSLSKESQSLRRFSEQGLYGDLFDGEGEYGLNIYDNRLISINTQHIKQLSDDAFILANKILFKKTIDIASRKAGKTAIYFDETKELFKHPEIALSLGTMVSQARSANTRITIIDQDAAYLSENKKFSKMILANTPLTVILGINSEDSYTPKTLGLSQNEESICRTLKIQPGRFSESYYITPNERIKLFNYSTPLFYALATTTPDDVTVMNYIFESFYSKRDDPRYTHMKTAIHFSDLFPGGVGQYPEWNEILIKNRKNIINTYLEIKNKHEVSV